MIVSQEGPLMEFLLQALSGTSRTRVKELLGRGQVLVDDVITTRYDAPLRPGQTVCIAKQGSKNPLRSPFVKIVYEDAHLLVVEKAAGIRTNTLPGEPHNSLKRILDDYGRGAHPRFTVHTVHRLDRVTSGLLLFAKTRDVQQTFVRNWRTLVTDRRYVALVEGRMEQDVGSVQSWLSENKMFVSYSSDTPDGGLFALTHYRTLQRGDDYSLVELKLETGRKNQIRVHMHDLGHPVCGDLKYGATSNPIGRVCLHAYKIQFLHPVTRRQLTFQTPVPTEFALSGTNHEKICRKTSGKKRTFAADTQK